MTPQDTPTLIDNMRTWSSVAAGQFHTCAVTIENEVYCWGVGGFGATGLGTPGDSDTPALVGSGFDLIAVGWTTTCAALASDATLAMARCWGDGSDGKVGNGSIGVEPMPVIPTFDPAP